MSILDRFFNYRAPSINTWTLPTPTASGEVVTAETSLNVSSVFAAIEAKANAVAKLPLQVFQKTANGRERNMAHRVAHLLETRPNPHFSPFLFKKVVEIHRNVYGVSYIKMDFNDQGIIQGLYHLHPPNVTVGLNVATGQKHYIEATADKQAPNVYDEEEIIRIFYFTMDGFTPKSPIAVARETIGVLKKQEKFLGKYYQNGTVTNGILKVDEQLNAAAREKLRDEWIRNNAGEDNAAKINIVGKGFTYENIHIPLQDAEFISSQRFGVEQIARIFGIPPHLIGDLSRSTFSNIEQQSMDFMQNTIQPIVTAWEEELNFKLFTDMERTKGLYVKFNLTSALRADSQSRATFYKTGLDAGWLSINEVRALEEQDRIEHGDTHRVTLNQVSIDIADDYQLLKANSNNNNPATKGGE